MHLVTTPPPMTRTGQRSPRWALWQWFDIPDGTDPTVVYLRRLRILATPWFGIYLHWIYLPDTDRHPHDHPWAFASLILRGGYTEQIFTTRPVFSDLDIWRRRARRSLHRMSLGRAHRIVQLDPGTVTLVVHGRRRRTWGFWTGEGFVPWQEYDRAGLGPDPFNS